MKKSILGLIILSAMTTSCVDDYFEPAQESKYMDKIGYKVNLTAGDDFKSRSAGSHDNRIVTIDPIDATIGGKQLYLHTTIDNEFPVVDKSQKAQSRGVEINDGDLDAIKVSAVVYDGKWGADEGFDPKPYMDNELSEAPAWSTNRYWPRESDRIRFYAYAPKNVLAAGPDYIDGLPSGASIPSFKYKVNDEVKNQQDLLVASADYAGNLCTVAHLEFGHALTAVNIQIAESVADFELTGLVISGLKNQGTYTYDWKDGAMENDKWIEGSNGDSDTISSTHDKGGWTDLTGSASYILFPRLVGAEQTQVTSLELTGNTGGDVVFTDGNMLLLMMPQELGEDAKITVTGRDKILNKDVTLSANIGGQEWVAGKRVTYTLSFNSTRIEYTLDVVANNTTGIQYYGIKDQGYTVKSYKVITRSGLDPVTIAVPWQAVAVENGTETVIPDGLQLSATSGPGVEDEGLTEGYTYCLLPNLHDAGSTSHENFLNGVSSPVLSRGTKDVPWDLSTENDFSENQSPLNTANCYMVFAPGYYTLPLVYGNAITGGANNSASYNGYGEYNTQTFEGTEYDGDYDENVGVITVPCQGLANFKDHADKAIIGPWIVNANNRGGRYAPAKAEIVWQDEPCLVTEIELSENKDYINFRVHEETVCDGNAVIAVKDESGTIMWSWHIWVNDGHAYHNYAADPTGKFDQRYISEDKKLFAPVVITNRRVVSSNWEDVSWGNTNDANTYTGTEFTMSRVFLGHCDGEVKNYKARDIIIRFKQVEADDVEFKGETKISDVTFSQLGETVSTVNNIPYYQYGRKDPMLPTGEKGVDKIHYGNNWQPNNHIQISDAKEQDGQAKLHEAIQNPHKFYRQYTRSVENKLRNYNWCEEGTFVNLWNTNSRSVPAFAYHSNFGGSNRYKFHAEFNDLISCGVTKSVYDPCPPGYSVPRVDAFTGASYHGMNVYPLWYDGKTEKSYFAFVHEGNSNATYSKDSNKGYHMYGNVWFNPDGNPYFDSFVDFNVVSIYATPMAKAGERGLFEDKWGGETLPIPFFGHRNAEGTLEKYGEFANALTSAPMCTQNMISRETKMEQHAQYMLVRLCIIKSKDLIEENYTGKMIPYSLRTFSGSDFDLAFGIIPAKISTNPTPSIDADASWSDGNDHNYNINF